MFELLIRTLELSVNTDRSSFQPNGRWFARHYGKQQRKHIDALFAVLVRSWLVRTRDGHGDRTSYDGHGDQTSFTYESWMGASI
jgi:hypothetical protein